MAIVAGRLPVAPDVAPAATKRKLIDWDAVEREFRAGVLTMRQIGERYGVSHTAIRKRAIKDGWDRDLSARIKLKAEAKVSRMLVSATVAEQQRDRVSERAVIEANAEMQAQIIVSHREDIRRARSIVMRLLHELELETGNRELLERLAELMREQDELSSQRMDAVLKALSLPVRAQTVERLANALSRLVALEREAFGIDRPETLHDPLAKMTPEEIDAELRALFAKMPFVEAECAVVLQSGQR